MGGQSRSLPGWRRRRLRLGPERLRPAKNSEKALTMFTTIKGGEEAIAASHELLSEQRRGDRRVPELSVQQIGEQLGLAVDRVMAEGSLYAPELAALAVKQSQGDLVEAAYLLRAYRATLNRV